MTRAFHMNCWSASERLQSFGNYIIQKGMNQQQLLQASDQNQNHIYKSSREKFNTMEILQTKNRFNIFIFCIFRNIQFIFLCNIFA